LKFRTLLDDKRRDEIERFRSELFRRIASGSPEKAEALERAEAAIKQYNAVLPDAQSRLDRANMDKRKGLQDMLDFYRAVITILETYRSNLS
jgi:hypothetical protein